jgi:hypothetical protein
MLKADPDKDDLVTRLILLIYAFVFDISGFIGYA